MKPKLLLVDDEKDIRDVLSMSLADLGYRVYTASNGEAALQQFKEVAPSIVMTDIKMPGIDGIDLLRRLKAENPDVEVVMISGHGDMNLAIQSLKYEAGDFITKPISIGEIETALRKVGEKITIKKKLREYTEHLEALVQEKTELHDHLATLGLLIGSISHGVKGLLGGLDGGVYILNSGFMKEDQGRIQEGLEVVKLMVERIRKMVLDILYYAKERDLETEEVDLRSFANEVAELVAPKIKQAGIQFEREFEPVLGKFAADPGFLHSALINILENAVDACTRDKAKTAHHIRFAVTQSPNQVRFDIADNGIGMDAATAEKIFTLFFSAKGHQGTGFGLFIADKIVKQHRGSISVKSKPGRGTRFTVTLPHSRSSPQ